MAGIKLGAARVKELEEKVARSKDVFRQAFERFPAADMRLIWSGGKDSTLTTWICREYCRGKGLAMPKAFTIDEGDAFEEIDELLKRYAKEWGIVLDWGRNEDVLKAAGHKLDAEVTVSRLSARNQAEIKRIGFDLKAFPFEAESYVGNHLMKTVVFNTYLEDNAVKAVFQGLRWDEQVGPGEGRVHRRGARRGAGAGPHAHPARSCTSPSGTSGTPRCTSASRTARSTRRGTGRWARRRRASR